MRIREARTADAAALSSIYAPYVTGTAVSMEYDAPDEAEFAARMERTMQKYPYLVAEEGGDILGYCYAGPFHGRIAYQWSAEASVYLRQDVRGRGIGRALYERLEESLREMGVRKLYACITFTDGDDDPRLSPASPRFHAALGFRECGRFRACCYKFGKWYDVIWMEKTLSGGGEVLPVVPYRNKEEQA